MLADPARLQNPETCYSINMLVQFLWKELKDTNLVRCGLSNKNSVKDRENLFVHGCAEL